MYHQVDYSMGSGKNKVDRQNRAIAKLYKEGKINANMDAVTRNPKTDDFVFVPPEGPYTLPVDFRNNNIQLIRRYVFDDETFRLIRPWSSLDKKAIREIADSKKITTKLLLITRSCTDIQHHTCGKCWWCQERAWAYPEEKEGRIRRVANPK
jgi:hypothetical protein